MGAQTVTARSHRKKESAESRSQKELQVRRWEALHAAREQAVNLSPLQVVEGAKVHERKFQSRQADITGNDTDGKAHAKEKRGMYPAEASKKAFMKAFKTVVDRSDVTPKFLDARSPMECCHHATSGTKRITLVLSQVDIIPNEVTNKGLAYLCNEFPAVALCAIVPGERGNRQEKLSA